MAEKLYDDPEPAWEEAMERTRCAVGLVYYVVPVPEPGDFEEETTEAVREAIADAVG